MASSDLSLLFPINFDPQNLVRREATFSCTLCPQMFTRAYNLRAHLRTHTDDRPFLCSICKKSFARQHNRKRHEGLHSGEKKLQCRGNLKAGGQWGCGRKFARVDALGRHFRSKAGRVCIRPLLDEETAEQGLQQQRQQHAAFPDAIVEKFPALANIRTDNDDNSALELLGNEFEDDLLDAGGMTGGRQDEEGFQQQQLPLVQPGIEEGSDAGWMEHLDLENIQRVAFPNAILEKWPMLANNRSDQDITTPDECDDDFTWEFLGDKFKNNLSNANRIASGSNRSSFDGGYPGGGGYGGENWQQGLQHQGVVIRGTVEGEGDTSATGEAGEDEDGGVDSVPNIFALGNRRIQKDEVGFGGTVEEEGDTSATGVTGADADEIIASIIKPFGSFGYREQRDEV